MVLTKAVVMVICSITSEQPQTHCDVFVKYEHKTASLQVCDARADDELNNLVRRRQSEDESYIVLVSKSSCETREQANSIINSLPEDTKELGATYRLRML